MFSGPGNVNSYASCLLESMGLKRMTKTINITRKAAKWISTIQKSWEAMPWKKMLKENKFNKEGLLILYVTLCQKLNTYKQKWDKNWKCSLGIPFNIPSVYNDIHCRALSYVSSLFLNPSSVLKLFTYYTYLQSNSHEPIQQSFYRNWISIT